MRSCEGTGKNIEQAIQNALFELKASREDVDIKILSEGGFLKKSKVLVSISEDALEKYEKREKVKQTVLKEETATENDEDFAEKFVKQKIEISKEPETIKPQENIETEQVETVENLDAQNVVIEKQKPEKKYTPNEFLQKIVDCLGYNANIEVEENETVCCYQLNGENLSELIGHHGECMMSLSYLMSMVCKTENRKKLILDIENYRKKREESLIGLAKRIADKVVKSKRYYKLEPMEASERRIIHLALQEDDRVTTLSKGEEPRRYLIVFPKEYDTKY